MMNSVIMLEMTRVAVTLSPSSSPHCSTHEWTKAGPEGLIRFLGLNQWYKGRESTSLVTNIPLHRLANSLLYSLSTMDGLPEERDYYVFTSESFGTDKPVAVTILPDEHVLRGTTGTKSVVSWWSPKNPPATQHAHAFTSGH
jgi:hypothetical protein